MEGNEDKKSAFGDVDLYRRGEESLEEVMLSFKYYDVPEHILSFDERLRKAKENRKQSTGEGEGGEGLICD